MSKRKGYGQFCPVAQAAEIVAERWTPLILRELLCGSTHFSEIRKGVPLISPTLLSTRLDELKAAGIIAPVIERGKRTEYQLTAAGKELGPIIEQLGLWGKRYVRRDLHEDEIDISLLMWDIRRRIRTDCLPSGRRVVRFNLSNVVAAKSSWWLVVDRGQVDLCLKHPGFDEDLVVASDARALTRIWRGDVPLSDAMRSGLIALSGSRDLANSFQKWFALSIFVEKSGTGAI